MDFRPSVQITGDLSDGMRKNGMMVGRLGDGDGDAVHHVLATVALKGKKRTKKEEEKMYFVQTRTDDAFTITPVRSSAKQSISEAAERRSLTLSYFIAKLFSLFFLIQSPSIFNFLSLPVFVFILIHSLHLLKQFARKKTYSSLKIIFDYLIYINKTVRLLKVSLKKN